MGCRAYINGAQIAAAKRELDGRVVMDSNNTVKISANLSETVVSALKDIAEKKGVSVTEALRQAISHEKYFLDATEQNHKVLLEDTATGRLREVVLNPSLKRR